MGVSIPFSLKEEVIDATPSRMGDDLHHVVLHPFYTIAPGLKTPMLGRIRRLRFRTRRPGERAEFPCHRTPSVMHYMGGEILVGRSKRTPLTFFINSS